MLQNIFDDKSTLFPNGNKTLLESRLTQIYFAIWRHEVTMNELSAILRSFRRACTIVKHFFQLPTVRLASHAIETCHSLPYGIKYESRK